MKHFFTSILVAITVVVSIGQSPAPYQKKIISHKLCKSGLIGINKNSYSKSRLAENQIYRLDSVTNTSVEKRIVSLYKMNYINEKTISDISTFDYDENGHLLFLEKTSIIYNQDESINTRYTIDWLIDEEKWDTLNKTVHHYDNQGLLIKEESFMAPDWELYLKTEYSYSEEGNLLLETTDKQHTDSPSQKSKTEYIYQNDNLSEINMYDLISDKWEHTHNMTFFHDAYGNIIEEIYSNKYIGIQDDLSPYIKYIHTFDLSVESNNIIFPDQHDNNMLTGSVMYDYDEEKEEWIEAGTLDFFYTLLKVTGVQSGSINRFNIHPNPCTDVIRLNLDDNTTAIFEVYDQLGAKVLSKNVKGNETISIQRLPAGLYNCVLTSGNEKSFTRLVKTN